MDPTHLPDGRTGWLPFLNVLRGAAALGAVLPHAVSFVCVPAPWLARRLPYSVMHYGAFAVEVFFVISGYCIAAAAVKNLECGRKIGAFALARWHRIYPPYWASLAVILVLIFAKDVLVRLGVVTSAGVGVTRLPDAATMAANLSLTQPFFRSSFVSVVSWTLCYEVSFYAAVAAGMLLVPRSPIILMRLLHGVTVAVLGVQVLFPGRVPYPLDMWAMFGMGVAAFHFVRAEREHLTEKREATEVVAILCVLGVAAAVRGGGSVLSPMEHPATLGFVAALAAFFLIFATRRVPATTLKDNPLLRPLEAVGVFSYSLYLIHFSCLGVAFQIMERLPDLPALPLARLLLAIAFAVAGGYTFYRLIEQPLLAWRTINRAPSR